MNRNVRIAKELVKLAKSLMASNEFEPHEYQLIHKNPDGSYVIAMFVQNPEDKESCDFCSKKMKELLGECLQNGLTSDSTNRDAGTLLQYGSGQCGYEITVKGDTPEQIEKCLHDCNVYDNGRIINGKTASNELVDVVRQAKASWMKNFAIDDSDETRVKASFSVGSEVMQYSFEFEVTRRSDDMFKYMVTGNCIFGGKHGFDDAKKLRELIKFGIDKMMFG